MLQLLRAKSFSLAYELPYCPVARALAAYGLRVSDGVAPRFGDRHNKLTWWEAQVLTSVNPDVPRLSVELPHAQYLLVERLFGWSVSDQIAVEHYLDGLNSIQELDHPVILAHMKPIWFVQNKLTEIMRTGENIY
jgi:hypothetical protein